MTALQIPPEELQDADRGDRHRVGAQRALPSVTSRTPRARAAAHSASVQPPSGPTSSAASDGAGSSLQAPRRFDIRADAPARPASAAAPAAARRAASRSVSGVRISGRTARRDCFTDASATRRQRSRRAPRISAATVVSVRLRDDRLNRRDAQHHRVADDVVHLVAFEHRLRERQRHGRLGRRLDARQQLHAHVAAGARSRRARGTRGRGRRTPTPCRRRRAAARASDAPLRRAAASTVSSPGSSAGAKKRCTADYTGCDCELERTRSATSVLVHVSDVARRRARDCYTRARMFFRGQIIGKYKILSTIGSGGFGTVYLAEDTWIDKKVALKVPHKQGVDFGELLREPRLLASLNHPEHRHHPHGGEAGERLLHRDGVRARRDARGDHRARRRARSAAARSTTPARSATPSTTRTATACCTAICGRRTCSSPTTAWSRSPTSAPRAFSRSPRTARRSSAARRTWRPSSFRARRCSPATSTRSASRCSRC